MTAAPQSSSSGTNELKSVGPDDCAEHMLLQARQKDQSRWTNIYAAQLEHFATYCFVRAIPSPTPQIAGGIAWADASNTLRHIARRLREKTILPYDIESLERIAAISPQAQAGETREKAEAWVWKDGIPAPAQQQLEPVAWLVIRGGVEGTFTGVYTSKTEAIIWLKSWQHNYKHDPKLQPLYAAPVASAQGQSDGEDDPYITDLKFAIEQNIKAARKYKARLDFMEVKYGAIDWDGTASPPAALSAGGVTLNADEAYHLFLIADTAARNERGKNKAVNHLRELLLPAYRAWHDANPGTAHPALAIPSTSQNTPVMQAAENAAKVVEGWSDAKREYADRVTSAQPLPPDWKQDQAETSRLAPNRPLCSCKSSQRDGQHMAWCPAVTSTDLGSGK